MYLCITFFLYSSQFFKVFYRRTKHSFFVKNSFHSDTNNFIVKVLYYQLFEVFECQKLNQKLMTYFINMKTVLGFV